MDMELVLMNVKQVRFLGLWGFWRRAFDGGGGGGGGFVESSSRGLNQYTTDHTDQQPHLN